MTLQIPLTLPPSVVSTSDSQSGPQRASRGAGRQLMSPLVAPLTPLRKGGASAAWKGDDPHPRPCPAHLPSPPASATTFITARQPTLDPSACRESVNSNCYINYVTLCVFHISPSALLMMRWYTVRREYRVISVVVKKIMSVYKSRLCLFFVHKKKNTLWIKGREYVVRMSSLRSGREGKKVTLRRWLAGALFTAGRRAHHWTVTHPEKGFIIGADIPGGHRRKSQRPWLIKRQTHGVVHGSLWEPWHWSNTVLKGGPTNAERGVCRYDAELTGAPQPEQHEGGSSRQSASE